MREKPDILQSDFSDPTRVMSVVQFTDICENHGLYTDGELEDANAPLVQLGIDRLNARRTGDTIWVLTADLKIRLMSRETHRILTQLRTIRASIDRALADLTP
jgi:hypothetical protein